MKRRGFFNSLAKAAAIIALAPQLAFRTKPEGQWIINPEWEKAENEIVFCWSVWESPTVKQLHHGTNVVRYSFQDGKITECNLA